MAAMVDITVLAQEVASISSEVDSMKTILSTKIGANDEIMTNVTDKLGSLTGKLDEFYTQLMENDGSIKKVISDNAQVINDNAAEVADLKARIGAKVGESDSVLVGLQAALGAQQAEIAMLKKQFAEQRPGGGTTGGGPGRFQSILDFKPLSGFEKLQNGAGFLSWANRFRNVVDQFRPFGREALKFLEGQSLEEVGKMAKSLGSGCDTADAVSELYEEKRPSGTMTGLEWSQFNKDLWAALVHLSSGEAAAKVDHSGQGEGLVAYIRVWNWLNANVNVQKYEHRMTVLSPDRCKTAATVADAVERWETASASFRRVIRISSAEKDGKSRYSERSSPRGWIKRLHCGRRNWEIRMRKRERLL